MQYQEFYAVQAETGRLLPYAMATVTVSATGERALLYRDGGPLTNPVQATGTGLVGFAVADGEYDIQFKLGPYTAPPISSILFFDPKTLLSESTGVVAQAEVWAGIANLAADRAAVGASARDSVEEALADDTILVGQSFTAPLEDGSLQTYRKTSVEVATPIGSPFASDARLVKIERAVQPNAAASTPVPPAFAILDGHGNAAVTIDDDGKMFVPSLKSDGLEVGESRIGVAASPDFAWAIVDDFGNVSLGVRPAGTVYLGGGVDSGWLQLSIGTDDTILHLGDSYSAAHYVLKDKAFISQLSALSPYRHVNQGVSGNDALDMQYRIVNGVSTLGTTFAAAQARLAFITSLTNDNTFRAADLTFYAENIRRLAETVRAAGPEPVITTEFPATSAEHALLRRVADEMGCGFIDCTAYDVEVGGLTPGPFHQGHPGTRTGGVFWLPMLDYIDRMPRPTRAIKIFRRRSAFSVGAISDLLYTGRVDRNLRWKELTVGHFSLTPENKFEELSQLGTAGIDFNFTSQADEYLRLAAGSPVAIADYALLEITLPGTAGTLDAVELTLGTSAAATVYVRDYLDVAASMPGAIQGATPTDATYLSKWNKPRGAWRILGVYAVPIVIPTASLRNSMQGNTLVVMLAGAFDLTALKVRYKGRESRSDLRRIVRAPAVGAELLSEPLCGTAPQLAGWTTSGAPPVLVPIDRTNAPRKPGAVNTPVDGVAVISATDMIGQGVTLPTETGALRRFRLTVWVRYFPHAFLDPSLYPTLDTAQIIDRIANPGAAPITSNTNDLRTLKCEIWSGTTYPAQGGAEFFDFAALQWRPVEFVIEAQAFRTGATLSFRLSCPDGAIQVGKASFKEISA